MDQSTPYISAWYCPFRGVLVPTRASRTPSVVSMGVSSENQSVAATLERVGRLTRQERAASQSLRAVGAGGTFEVASMPIRLHRTSAPCPEKSGAPPNIKLLRGGTSSQTPLRRSVGVARELVSRRARSRSRRVASSGAMSHGERNTGSGLKTLAAGTPGSRNRPGSALRAQLSALVLPPCAAAACC